VKHPATSKFLGAMLALACLLLGPMSPAAGADKETRVVYHVGDASEQATLLFINNHLAADPTARIAVVAHSAGIKFLLKGASDKNGVEYEPAIKELIRSKRVAFYVCNISLVSRQLNSDERVEGVSIVDSGVREIARLQAQEGYAYIRP
jgi:intracellular sulfur oxidation DsrE/DsrF family protein